MTENETKLCNNCKKQISANNFMMHEMHCKRHIGLCEHCKEPIPTGEMSVHFEETHAKIKCPKCKVEVEKMKLEEHEENDCSKRPMKCVYCELEFPKDEFNTHIDYCGSRTESCPKCLQYIKLKDQTKHEESNCLYPEASKPKNTNRIDSSELNSDGYGMNPFAFEELSRVIGQRGTGEPRLATRPPRLGENQMDNGRQRVARPSKVPNVSRPAAGKTNVNNASRDRRKSKDPPNAGAASSEVDYDQLLAMHLAQDLNQEREYDEVVKALEKPAPISPTQQFEQYAGMDRNTFSEDLVLIPCEFCGEPFTSDDLVQHQSGCSLDRISAMLPKLTSSTSNNSRSNLPVSPALVDPPEIINNLRPFDASEWQDDTVNPVYIADDADDDMLLPCEFCDDLFPMETLIHHQANCERNTTMTPRLTTPVATRSRVRNHGLNLNHDLADQFPNLSSRRHQPAPGLAYDSDSEDDTVVRNTQSKYTIGATSHRVRKPSTTLSKQKDTSSSATSPTANTNKMLRKYGVEGQERGDYYTRTGSQNSRVSDTNSWTQPSASVPKKRTDTDARTRDTLNRLLNDRDDRSSHDLLGHIGAPKTRRNESNTTRQNASVVPATRNGTKARVSNANAREVQRELGRSGATATNTEPPIRNRTTKPNIEVRIRPSAADELSDAVVGNQRSRAQVFGARNTKPMPTRKKTEEY